MLRPIVRPLLLAILMLLVGYRSAIAADQLTNANEPQRPAFFIYKEKNSLPENAITALAFDQKGYLWVGTYDGAAYYNGRDWVVVNMPNRTVSNSIVALRVGSDGSVWMGTDGAGLARWQQGQWQNYDRQSGLPSNSITSLLETRDSDGSTIIWAGTNNGLAKFQHNKWTIINTESGLPDNHIYSLLETVTSNGSIIWVGTANGLAKFADNQWRKFDTADGLPNNDLRCLLETSNADGSKIIWAGTNGGGLAKFQDNHWSKIDQTDGLPSNRIISLLESRAPDGSKILWVGSYGGGLAKLQNNRWQIYNTSSGLPGDIVFSLLESRTVDGSGSTLWIGTNNRLARLDYGGWQTLNTATGLPSNSIASLMETTDNSDNKVYWIGTNGGGLVKLQGNQFTIFNTKNGLANDHVYALLETSSADGGKIIWAGTEGGGLAKLEQDRWSSFNTANGLPSNSVACLLETVEADGSKILWVGTNNGLARFQNDQWTIFNTSNGLPNNNIRSLVESRAADGSKIIWVGTYGGGLAKWQQQRWTIFDTKAGLANDHILSLFKTADGANHQMLWIGTSGGGVSRLDLDSPNTKFVNFADNSQPELPNNTVYQVLVDAKARIYLFTNKGVARLTSRTPTPDNPAEYTIKIFTLEDGLPSEEFNHGVGMVDSRGRIWAGTDEGVALFDPQQEVADRSQKPLLIEHTWLSGKDFAIDHAELAYDQNNISFLFSLLSFLHESDTRYRTQLLGIDKEPSDWSKEFKVNYNMLPAGNYTFRVWGRDYAGNVSGPLELSFQVKTAPWKTWWAYCLYLALILAIIYSAVRLRLQVLQSQNKLLEAKIAERTAELANKMAELKLSKQQIEEQVVALIESNRRADRIFSALAEALPGTVLDEKYRLDEKIGSGGFGAVYRATHLQLKRPIAVKIFRPTPGNDSAEGLERFQQEAIAACRINHPNAVSVLDSGISSEGIAYLVMELLHGHTLTQELRIRGALSVNRCAKIIIPICDVLSKAHAMGLIHRDIKPDNVFIHKGESGEMVKLVDFGISKLMETRSTIDGKNLTATGGLIGTPTYMAPERCDNKPYDGRSDVYSLGVMMFEMLCGRVPFSTTKGGSVVSVMMQHLSTPPPSLARINPKVPPEMEALVMRALTKNPEARPTAKEFAQELAVAIGIELEVNNSGLFRFSLDVPASETAEIAEKVNTANQNTVTNIFDSLPTIEPDSDSSEQNTLIKPK